LAPGERRTMHELIYGALLNSGNDACVAIAEAIAGSERAFAALMTARARQLGARETTFLNANGLPQRGHLTSAHDLAVIARAALANEIFAAAVRTKVKNIPWDGKPWDRRLINHNKLLWRYEGADGVKTGYTRESGHCLVASATRNGRRLIAVILDARDTYGEARVLLDYGFNRFRLAAPRGGIPRSVAVSGGLAGRVKTRTAGVLAYAVPREQASRVRLKVSCPRVVPAPISRGQRLGWASLIGNGRTLARVPLVAAGKVERRGILAALARFLSRLFGGRA
ncbi:MAG: D-alanyl-D-alanine carboxypeptidase family protein, partial [Bacteroidota bacterium]